MNHTSIEWVRNPPDNREQGYTWNPVVGCSGAGCAVKEVCYARSIAKFRGRCPLCREFKWHLHGERLVQPIKVKKSAGIFLSMCDLYDKEANWSDVCSVLNVMWATPWHRYYVLTKQPQRAVKTHGPAIPDNVCFGVTVNRASDLWRIDKLREVDALVRLVSFEPLYEDVSDGLNLEGIDWVIIGGETRSGKTTYRPDTEDVACLTIKAKHQGCKVFMKGNLQTQPLIQEFPSLDEEQT